MEVPGASVVEAVPMYEDLSEPAKRALQRARQEARRLNMEFVGTEHVLLAVLREGGDGVTNMLAACDLDVEVVSRQTERTCGQMAARSGPSSTTAVAQDGMPLTPMVQRALGYAAEEAAQLGHPGVGPEHLLLGLAREPESVAAGILESLGASLRKLRNRASDTPVPEKHDWTLQPESAEGFTLPNAPPVAGAGVLLPADEPSPLEAPRKSVLRRDKERRPRRDDEPSARVGRRRRPSEADLDFPVVHRQLRALQYLVAAVGGAFFGGMAGESTGALVGWLAGCAIAALRNGHVGGIVGCVTGGYAGYVFGKESFIACVIWGLAGLAVGACLGDWRRWKAPPGGLLSTDDLDAGARQPSPDDTQQV
jgi:hypothetical protein